MKVWMLWHGGSSYAHSAMEDVEEFYSFKTAKEVFWSREEQYDPYYPCVEESSASIYFHDPRETCDPYPDRQLSIGPRGGVKVERC